MFNREGGEEGVEPLPARCCVATRRGPPRRADAGEVEAAQSAVRAPQRAGEHSDAVGAEHVAAEPELHLRRSTHFILRPNVFVYGGCTESLIRESREREKLGKDEGAETSASAATFVLQRADQLIRVLEGQPKRLHARELVAARALARHHQRDVRQVEVSQARLTHCTGRQPPFLAVTRPATPYKSATQNRFAVGNATAA